MVAITGTSWFTIAAACTALLATVTEAHLSMTVSKADDESYLTTALRIPHGCKSANMSPTRAITVTIPQDIYKLQVGYVAGWNASTEIETIAPVKVGKSEVTQRIKTVKWEGGPLPAGQFLDFGMRILLPKAKDDNKAELLFFPVLQECETGNDLWNQVPGTDGYNHDLGKDAPHIEINTHPDDTPWTENRLVKGQSTSGASSLKQGALTIATAAIATYYLV